MFNIIKNKIETLKTHLRGLKQKCFGILPKVTQMINQLSEYY